MIPAGTDFSLYFITDTALCGGPERVPEVVREAALGGAGVVQVRDKQATDAEFERLARACAAAVREAEDSLGRGVELVVNDRLSVAAELGLHLHVGQSDAGAEAARKALGPELMVGLSVSTPEETRRAVGQGIADVVGIGPVWTTPTKGDAAAPLGPDGTAECAELARAGGLAGVAIGGINASTATQLAGVPVDGLCVVSAIAAVPDPRASAAEMLRISRTVLTATGGAR
ncbi:thiamine phosphate synthase [Rothia halotolerans]|uniref:thiamine phosphate synthase n=1 Tax=Rothia halotolerans TaxID=405770 RepID=UPI00101CA569|nr:thiamine phosphate synthase [Rothia halotolerans]